MKQKKNENTIQHVQYVVKYPLDEIIRELKLPKPQYLKIDVDGAEKQVLDGAKQILKSEHLKGIFIELTGSAEDKALLEKIESYGFKIVSKHPVEDYTNLFNYIFSRV